MQVRGKLGKRARQLRFLGLHPVEHWRCNAAIRRARAMRVAGDNPRLPYKYLGDYLAFSMTTADRRRALVDHYMRLGALAQASGEPIGRDNILIWELPETGRQANLRIFLEPAQLAPMEGELQLRFEAGRLSLFTLTFLIASGELFDSFENTVLFIGGVQGGLHCREEMREAAKHNGEIAPVAMLLLAVRALAKVLSVDQILAVAEDEQIATSYASDKIRLDYRDFWTQAGGVRHGNHYLLPKESDEKPLSEIPRTHRSRTRRKRERKHSLRETIETRIIFVLRQRSAIPQSVSGPGTSW